MIAGPGIVHSGKIDATTMAVYDVAPTLYEFAGIDATKALAKKPVLPMVGVSFKRYLTGESLQPPRSRYGVELHNQAAWIDGDWKLRRLVKTFPQAATRRGGCSILSRTRWKPMMSPHNIRSGCRP